MRLAPVITALIALATAASAVVIDSGDGTGNQAAPVPDPGWGNVGTLGVKTAVYLGGRFALTAGHNGPGNVVLGGVTYSYVPGTAVQLTNDEDGTYADLLMFQIHPEPPLPALPIASVTPTEGTAVILAGNGRDRGPTTSCDPNGPDPPGPFYGYEWGTEQSLRWGTNSVVAHLFMSLLDGTQTWSFGTSFDEGGSAYEAQATIGDSGGPAFALNGSDWELAGLLFAIGPNYSNQPPESSLYGNLTFSADLSFYRDEILDVMALPEPTGGFGLCAAAVAMLARWRRTRAQPFARTIRS